MIVRRGARGPHIKRGRHVAKIIEQLARHLPRIDQDRAVMLLGQFRAHDVCRFVPADHAFEELELLEQPPFLREGRPCRDDHREGEMQGERNLEQGLPVELEHDRGDENRRGRIGGRRPVAVRAGKQRLNDEKPEHRQREGEQQRLVADRTVSGARATPCATARPAGSGRTRRTARPHIRAAAADGCRGTASRYWFRCALRWGSRAARSR